MTDKRLPVVGFEGIYEVSSAGSVRRVGRNHGARPGRPLKHRVGFGGYPVVRMTVGCVTSTRYVHRIVAAAFIGPCPEGMEVNHKDRNRSNPSADNLEYLTRSDNNRHAYANGVVPIKGEAKDNAKLTEADVRDIRASGLGPRELGRRYGVAHHTIIMIQRRQKWKHVV